MLFSQNVDLDLFLHVAQHDFSDQNPFKCIVNAKIIRVKFNKFITTTSPSDFISLISLLANPKWMN